MEQRGGLCVNTFSKWLLEGLSITTAENAEKTGEKRPSTRADLRMSG